MLPQGMFSVAVATVLFPALSRFVSRGDLDGLRALLATGTRGVFLLLIPCAALTLVLAEPITRLVYQRGAFNTYSTDRGVHRAVVVLVLACRSRGSTCCSRGRSSASSDRGSSPALSAIVLVLNVAVSIALAGPLGIAGIVIGTVVSTFAMTLAAGAAAAHRAARAPGGGAHPARDRPDARRGARARRRLLRASGGRSTTSSGRSLPAQICSVGLGLAAGVAVYAAGVLALRVPEAQRISRLVRERLA